MSSVDLYRKSLPRSKLPAGLAMAHVHHEWLDKFTRSKIGLHHHSAAFTFTARGDATSFQCALVRLRSGKRPKAHYTRCGASKRYNDLAAGSYEFLVRAVGPGGTEATPITYRFRIG
ncbi:MAG TPA: hypothetical protein VGG41_15885 [Solirubrobacteraceae bacterium]|jgi:hypothetical protein